MASTPAAAEATAEAATSAEDGHDEEVTQVLQADGLRSPSRSPQRAPTTTFTSANALPAAASTSPTAEATESADARRSPVTAEQEAVFRRRRLTREHMDQEIESPPVHPPGAQAPWGSPRSASAQAGADEALKPRQTKARRSRRISREPSEKERVVLEEREQPFFPKLGALGTFSSHGIEPGEGEGSGAIAKINQDCGCVCYPFAQDPELALLVVMDGHGPEGEKVSNSLMQALVQHLEDSTLLQSQPAAALEASFEAAHQALLAGVQNGDAEVVGDPEHSGATALAILLRPSSLVVAHAGDCRALLGVAVKVDKSPGAAIDATKVRAWELNTEHKP